MTAVLGSVILYNRIRLKTQEPEAPEAFLREMIHTHSKLGELFKVETTSTIDFKLDYIREMPDEKKFPEFNHNIYKFMNNDGWF